MHRTVNKYKNVAVAEIAADKYGRMACLRYTDLPLISFILSLCNIFKCYHIGDLEQLIHGHNPCFCAITVLVILAVLLLFI